jgi:tripartite-type tricarboxylate transporter receptor subunit TctC
MLCAKLLASVIALCVSALFGAAVAQGESHDAQSWPTRPVRIIVNYAPGGSTDNATRPFADHLSKAFGQQFVI